MGSQQRNSLPVGKGKATRQRWVPYLLLACLMTLAARLPHEQNWHIADYLDTFGLDGCFTQRGAFPTDVVADKLWPTRDFLLIEVPSNSPPELLPRIVAQLKQAKVVAIDLMLVNKRGELKSETASLFASEISRWKREEELLANAIKANGNVIIGCWPNVRRVAVAGKFNKTITRIEWQRPAPAIWKAARWHAHLRVEPSLVDGKTRAVPLFETTSFADDKTSAHLPALSLAVAAALQALSQKQIAALQIQKGQLLLKERRLLLPDDGLMTINYLGGREQFSNSRIHWDYGYALNDCLPKDFAGKIVFLGRTDFTAKDDFTTPYGDMPGIHVHMHAAATLIGAQVPPQEIPFWKTWLLALIGSILLVLSLQRLPLSGSLAVGVLLCLLTFSSCYALFISSHRYFPVSVPVLAIIFTYNGIALFEYGRTRAVLARFVGRDFVSAILNPLHHLTLGGQSEVATAFFCDLRGFSMATEQLPAHITEPLVTAYTSKAAEVAMRFGGRVIDYFGDGIFVLFQQSSKFDAGHATRALQAAQEAQSAVEPILATWSQTCGVELEFAVGINSGEMMIGVIGSEEHMKLGAVGDAVNVASRVQGLTRSCGYGILVTQETKDLLDDEASLTLCGQFAIKGRQQEVIIFGAGQSINSTAQAGETHSLQN